MGLWFFWVLIELGGGYGWLGSWGLWVCDWNFFVSLWFLPRGSWISEPNHLKSSTIHKHGKPSLYLGVLALLYDFGGRVFRRFRHSPLCSPSLSWVLLPPFMGLGSALRGPSPLWLFARWEGIAEIRENTETREKEALETETMESLLK